MDLNKLILDAVQAVSLILVFVTMLFTLRYPGIIKDIGEDIPEGERAKKREKDRLLHSFLVNSLPPLFLNGIAAYIFLPLTIKIIKQTHISLWQFDFLPTAFVLISFWVWCFFIWSLYLGFRMIKKIFKI